MAKAGSGFRRASGAAAVSATGGRGGRWTVADLQGAREEVTRLYWNAYRRVGDVYKLDSKGNIIDTGKGFGRFADQAEALSYKLAEGLQHVDSDAQSMYRDMQRWASRITASEQERKEFDMTYTGEKNFAGRGRGGGDASEAARQMAGLGLIPHEIAAMGNNVDVMNGINDAMNAVKGMIYTNMSRAEKDALVGDIFMGLMERYKGVERGENRRRR
jgi:hypothetical protein